MPGTKGMQHYEREVKEKVVKIYLEEQRSYAVIAKELWIRKTARIATWVRMYRKEGTASFIKPIGQPRKDERDQRELERLRTENALLKKFQAELRKL